MSDTVFGSWPRRGDRLGGWIDRGVGDDLTDTIVVAGSCTSATEIRLPPSLHSY
jgi:hypothetical protein